MPVWPRPTSSFSSPRVITCCCTSPHDGAFGAGGELLVLERGEGPTCSTPRPALHRRPLEPVLRPDRLLLRRGDGRGDRRADVDARVQHQLGHRPPAGDRARRRARRRRARGPQPRLLHHRRLGVGRGGVEARPRALPGQRRAAAHQGDRARPSPTTASRSARSRSPACPASRSPSARRRSTSPTSRTPTLPAPDGDDPERPAPALLAEIERAIAAAGPDEVALIIAEPVQNAGGCLVPPPGYWHGLREIADGTACC